MIIHYSIFIKLSLSDAPAGPGVIELKVSGLKVVKHQNSIDSGRGTFKLAGATIIELKV